MLRVLSSTAWLAAMAAWWQRRRIAKQRTLSLAATGANADADADSSAIPLGHATTKPATTDAEAAAAAAASARQAATSKAWKRRPTGVRARQTYAKVQTSHLLQLIGAKARHRWSWSRAAPSEINAAARTITRGPHLAANDWGGCQKSRPCARGA